ncbi:catalase [Streptomyces europaeiscabiei]|uniref:catalase n=1 Tax=Streptomyces europaeiscabiei TaxID=146819 RepID=UPI0038D50116
MSRPGATADRNRRSGYADFLRGVGGRTTMFVRLSTVGEGLADADLVRVPSGPAINLCTEEVSYGLAGNLAPVTFIKTSIRLLPPDPGRVPDQLLDQLRDQLHDRVSDFTHPEPRPVPGDTRQPPDAPPATAADRPG